MGERERLKELGRRIRAIRLQCGLTQVELAIKCEFDRNYIGMLERGERNPTYLTLCKMAEHLEMNVSDLIK